MPGRLECGSWKFRAGCCWLLASFVLIGLMATVIGNHGGGTGNLIAGVTVYTVTFLLLAVAAPLRFARIRFLDLERSGVTVHSFWRRRRIPWGEIQTVDVEVRKGEVVTWSVPAIRLASGKRCALNGSASLGAGSEAAVLARDLLAARDGQPSRG